MLPKKEKEKKNTFWDAIDAMKFSKVPQFFFEKKCKKEAKRRGFQGPVGLFAFDSCFFWTAPQMTTPLSLSLSTVFICKGN